MTKHPDGEIVPLRGFIEDADGGLLTEFDAGYSYTITPDLWSMLTPAQRRAMAGRDGTADIRGGDDELPPPL